MNKVFKLNVVSNYKCKLLDLDIFMKCTNVKYVIIHNMNLRPEIECCIVLCTNIRSIRFTKCNWKTSINFLQYLPKLRAIKFTTGGVIGGQVQILEKCSKLRMLEMVDKRNHLVGCSLPITHLKINSSLVEGLLPLPIFLSEFNVFPRFKYLNLSNCRSVVHLDVGNMLYELCYLNIERCHVKGAKDGLNVMKKLRYLNVRGCVFVCDEGDVNEWVFNKCVVVQ